MQRNVNVFEKRRGFYEKNYDLSYIFPNPDDGIKVDLWYEEY